MYDTTMYETTNQTGVTALLSTYMILILVIAVIMIVANWKVFTKAGKPGWASIIPLYNMYVMFEIAGMNGWMFLLTFVPIANIIIQIMLYLNLAKKFGKSTGFGNAEYNK